MSTKEKATYIFEHLTEEQLEAFVTLFGSIAEKMADEFEDDVFCENLLNNYLNDDAPDKHDSISLENLADELGIDLSEL
ncbi:MAG: hypothetical protein NC093_11545 [Alistipes sp.]|nr:hypothetical protein [Alistipes sp.]